MIGEKKLKEIIEDLNNKYININLIINELRNYLINNNVVDLNIDFYPKYKYCILKYKYKYGKNIHKYELNYFYKNIDNCIYIEPII